MFESVFTFLFTLAQYIIASVTLTVALALNLIASKQASQNVVEPISSSDLMQIANDYRQNKNKDLIEIDENICKIAQKISENGVENNFKMSEYQAICPDCSEMVIFKAENVSLPDLANQWDQDEKTKQGILSDFKYGCGLGSQDSFLFVWANKTPQIVSEKVIASPSISKKINFSPSPKITLVPTKKPIPLPTQDTGPWGVAKQVDEHSWTMKIAYDDRMATPKEIFEALNHYRGIKGQSQLQWDDNLAKYAQSRADFFTKNGKMDGHAGFMEYVNKEENLKNLGFWSVGENSSYGYKLLGVHLIEWVYAGDKPHNDNQLNSDWSHVGIGVSGNQTDLIFGGNKL